MYILCHNNINTIQTFGHLDNSTISLINQSNKPLDQKNLHRENCFWAPSFGVISK